MHIINYNKQPSRSLSSAFCIFVCCRQCIKPGCVQNTFQFPSGSVCGGSRAGTTVARSQPAAPSSYLTMTGCCMPARPAFYVQVNVMH